MKPLSQLTILLISYQSRLAMEVLSQFDNLTNNLTVKRKSSGATQGLSANQKPILKQRIEHADITEKCLIFRLVTFDPKWLTLSVRQ